MVLAVDRSEFAVGEGSTEMLGGRLEEHHDKE